MHPGSIYVAPSGTRARPNGTGGEQLLAGSAWYGFRRFTAANYFATTAALGLNFVEIPLYWQVIEDTLFDLRRVDDLRRDAEVAGVEMHAGVAALDLAPPFDIRGLPISDDAVAFNLVLAKRVIDLGVTLGLRVVRLTEPNVDATHLDIAEQYMEAYGRVLHDLGIYAEQRGIQVVAENYGLTSTHMRTLLDAADHANVGTLFDPCNYFRNGEDPLAALQTVSDKIFYCHLKDTVTNDPRTPDQLFQGSRWRPSVAVGKGDIDWETLIPALASVYSGVTAIECETAEDVVFATTQSRDFLVAIAGNSLTLSSRF